MQFEIIPTKQFEDDLRYYLKKKKFKHILEDVDDIVKELEKGNLLGDAIPGLVFDDNETVKVRIANTDTRVGKSNGYRMIYYVVLYAFVRYNMFIEILYLSQDMI